MLAFLSLDTGAIGADDTCLIAYLQESAADVVLCGGTRQNVSPKNKTVHAGILYQELDRCTQPDRQICQEKESCRFVGMALGHAVSSRSGLSAMGCCTRSYKSAGILPSGSGMAEYCLDGWTATYAEPVANILVAANKIPSCILLFIPGLRIYWRKAAT